jgi:plastocyanin
MLVRKGMESKESRSLVRAGLGVAAGFALAFVLATCGNSDGGGPTGLGGAPTLKSIAPDSGDVARATTTVTVFLVGSGFDAGNVQVSVSGSGVDVTNVSVLSATSLTADFIIAAGTALGDRQVTVTTDAGTTASVVFTLKRPSHAIQLQDDRVVPANLVVEAGDRVVWNNVGDHDHTVSVYGDFEWEDVLVKPGETFSHVFETPGDYAFICIYHAEVSNVTVQ